MNVLAPYIQAGLEADDQCVIVAEPSASCLITDRLRGLGVEVEADLDSRKLLISEGSSEIEERTSMFESVISLAASAGRTVIRIGGDMTWALSKMPTAEKLLEWEAFYDLHIGPRASFVALCQYDHMRFGGTAIMCALQTHPLSIIGGIVQENPYYQDPSDFLQDLSKSGTSTSQETA